MASAEPFVFHGCLELRELLPYEAHDSQELLTEMERVPVESIFCHTSAALLRRPIPEAYPNDFALWAAIEVRERRLAERLAAIDPFHAGSLEQVRDAIVSVLSDHLRHRTAAPPRSGEPFRFFQIHLVPVPTGHEVRSLGEFRDALAEVDASALFYHVVEARYRPERERGDFAEWIHTSLGRPELAERLARIDPYVGTLDRIRDRHLAVLNDALATGRG